MRGLVQRRLTEWRSQAIRSLLELENAARTLRDQLEDGDIEFGEAAGQISDIHSRSLDVVRLSDMSVGLSEADIS